MPGLLQLLVVLQLQYKYYFDNSSQLSYVIERLQWQLNLKPTRFVKLHLNNFGHDGYKTQACAVVKQDSIKGNP